MGDVAASAVPPILEGGDVEASEVKVGFEEGAGAVTMAGIVETVVFVAAAAVAELVVCGPAATPASKLEAVDSGETAAGDFEMVPACVAVAAAESKEEERVFVCCWDAAAVAADLLFVREGRDLRGIVPPGAPFEASFPMFLTV